MYSEAASEFQKAAEIDPGFSQASDKLQETRMLAETPMISMLSSPLEMERFEDDIEADAEEEMIAAEPAVDELAPSTADRLDTIDTNTGDVIPPSEDVPEPNQPTTPQERQNTVMQITVQW